MNRLRRFRLHLFATLILFLAVSLIYHPLRSIRAQPMPSPWPMASHDAQHTGRSQFLAVQNPKLAWQYYTYWNLLAPPVIGSDGTIYIGSPDGIFYAIRSDGTLKWSFTVEGTSKWISSPAAIDEDGTIYFGDEAWNDELVDTSYIYALNPDGLQKWRFYVGTIANQGVTIGEDGTIYFGDFRGTLYALNHAGQKIWSTELLGQNEFGGTHTTPAVGYNHVIYADSFYSLYAVDIDGTILWEYPTEDLISYAPVVGEDGTIYFGSEDIFYALNPNGTLKWQYSADWTIRMVPTIQQRLETMGRFIYLRLMELFRFESGWDLEME